MTPQFIPYRQYIEYSVEQMRRRAESFYAESKRRRSVRAFSDRPVSRDIIDTCLLAAGTAPSGANLQPWHFVVISHADVKAQIRAAAEKEERDFYRNRAPKEWLEALAPLDTDENKEFLTIAPYLIAIFAKSYDILPSGNKVKNYYVPESVGIAIGIFITALHHAGLASLTHTPSPMGFLNDILERPRHERPMILLVVGYPADDVKVPVHATMKKPLEDIATFI